MSLGKSLPYIIIAIVVIVYSLWPNPIEPYETNPFFTPSPLLNLFHPPTNPPTPPPTPSPTPHPLEATHHYFQPPRPQPSQQLSLSSSPSQHTPQRCPNHDHTMLTYDCWDNLTNDCIPDCHA